MACVNIFADGTWLFNACRYGRSIANATEYPESNFSINFDRLNTAIVAHVSKEVDGTDTLEIGDRYLATSIFELPEDLDDWPARYPEDDCTSSQIERVKNGVKARDNFVQKALSAGYKSDAVFRPKLKPYIVGQLGEGKYQEKQVGCQWLFRVFNWFWLEDEH